MLTNLLLALLTASLFILALPGFSFYFLAPAALAPLLYAAARESSPWKRLLLGEVAGFVFWFGVCYWIQFVLAYHGGMGEWGGWGTFLLFCFLKAIHMAVFTLLAGYVIKKPYGIPAVAALWVGLERTHGTFGFAWMALGNAGIDMGVPMRLAPWVGVYGLSFVFMMLATALTLTALKRPRRELAWLLVLPLLFLLPALLEAEKPTQTLVALQPNIDIEQSWSRNTIDTTIDRFAYRSMEQALEAGDEKPNMIVWPEIPAPFYYELDPVYRDKANNLARLTQLSFLTGTVAYDERRSPLNSAQLVSPTGEPVGRYDKMYLVPFGEFVPAPFGFVNRVTDEAGDFAPGTEVKLMPVDGRQAGAFICYESVFPHLVRRFAKQGAEVFLNLSNDGYFGTSAARYQHLFIARMRAAENRRWLVRVTNNGVTASIDPAGRIREQLTEYEEVAGRLHYDYET
jgi:apolipoprotein N-acyltransferase